MCACCWLVEDEDEEEYRERGASRGNNNGRGANGNDSNGNGGVYYQLLSRERRREIDNLRTDLLQRYMKRFTVVLREEDLLLSEKLLLQHKLPFECLGERADKNDVCISSGSQKVGKDVKEGKESSDSDVGIDIEMESTDESTSSEDKGDQPHDEENDSSLKHQRTNEEDVHHADKDADDEVHLEIKATDVIVDIADDAAYTHVSIPFPGYDRNGIHVSAFRSCNKSIAKTKKSPWFRRFARSRNETNASNNITSVDSATTAKYTKEVIPKASNTNKRTIPISCAICLTEYAPNDHLSYSSNESCTHAFHTDCITQWLVALGKRQCKMQRFSEVPNEKELVEFGLDCPCCRQEFCNRAVMMSGEDGWDDEEVGLDGCEEESV